MELDARLLLTLGGMLVSVVSAAAIVRQKLATVIDQLDDIEKRLREIDKRWKLSGSTLKQNISDVMWTI